MIRKVNEKPSVSKNRGILEKNGKMHSISVLINKY